MHVGVTPVKEIFGGAGLVEGGVSFCRVVAAHDSGGGDGADDCDEFGVGVSRRKWATHRREVAVEFLDVALCFGDWGYYLLDAVSFVSGDTAGGGSADVRLVA